MRISEEDILKAIHDWVDCADYEDLAKLGEHMFGGKLFFRPLYDRKGNYLKTQYDFVPDENYYGAFDHLEVK